MEKVLGYLKWKELSKQGSSLNNLAEYCCSYLSLSFSIFLHISNELVYDLSMKQITPKHNES